MKFHPVTLTRLPRLLVALVAAATLACTARAQEGGEKTKREIEKLSPDGRLGFLYTESETDDEKAYDLIEKASGKVLARVAESRFDEGPSSRFSILVLATFCRVWACHTPSTKNGNMTAPTQSLAVPRIFSSFSQRKSLYEMKSPTNIVISNASAGKALAARLSWRSIIPSSPDTRYVAGRNCVTISSQEGNIEVGNVAPLRNSMGR